MVTPGLSRVCASDTIEEIRDWDAVFSHFFYLVYHRVSLAMWVGYLRYDETRRVFKGSAIVSYGLTIFRMEEFSV